MGNPGRAIPRSYALQATYVGICRSRRAPRAGRLAERAESELGPERVFVHVRQFPGLVIGLLAIPVVTRTSTPLTKSARNNAHGRFSPVSVENVYDHNRDRYVNATDEIIAQ